MKSDAPEGSQTDDNNAAAILARAILHRSKLNTIDVIRELAQHCDAAGKLTSTSTAIVFDLGNRLKANVQLAVEYLLRGQEIAGRIERDPTFAQLAIDAFYIISRAWENDDLEIDLSHASVVSRLLERLGQKCPVDQDEAKKNLAQFAGDLDVTLLAERVATLATLLSNFDLLRNTILREQLEPQDRDLLTLLATTPGGGLLEKANGDANSQTYKFRFDIYGRDLKTWRDLVGVTKIPPAIAIEINEKLSLVEEIRRTLVELHLSESASSAVALVPPSIPWSEIDRASRELHFAISRNQPYDKLVTDLGALRELAQTLAEKGRTAAILLAFA